MDESAKTADNEDGHRREITRDDRDISGQDQPEKPPELRLTVVENEVYPDRGTVHPPSLTGLERMETWLSADTSIFVELSTWR